MEDTFVPEVSQQIINLLSQTYRKEITPENVTKEWLRKCQLKFYTNSFHNSGLPALKYQPEQVNIFLERLMKLVGHPLASWLYLQNGFGASYLRQDSEFRQLAHSLVTMELAEVVAQEQWQTDIGFRSQISAEDRVLFGQVLELTDLTFWVLPESGDKLAGKFVSARELEAIKKAKDESERYSSDGDDFWHC